MVAVETNRPLIYIREKLVAAWAVLVAAFVNLKEAVVASFWALVIFGTRFFYRNRKKIFWGTGLVAYGLAVFLLTKAFC